MDRSTCVVNSNMSNLSLYSAMDLTHGVVSLGPHSFFINQKKLLASLYESFQPCTGLYSLAAPYVGERMPLPRPIPHEAFTSDPREPENSEEGEDGDSKKRKRDERAEERPAKRQRKKKKAVMGHAEPVDPALLRAIAALLSLVQKHLKPNEMAGEVGIKTANDTMAAGESVVVHEESNLLEWGSLVDLMLPLSTSQRSGTLQHPKRSFSSL